MYTCNYINHERKTSLLKQDSSSCPNGVHTIERFDNTCIVNTVEPLIVDPQNKGHNRNNLSIKDTS